MGVRIARIFLIKKSLPHKAHTNRGRKIQKSYFCLQDRGGQIIDIRLPSCSGERLRELVLVQRNGEHDEVAREHAQDLEAELKQVGVALALGRVRVSVAGAEFGDLEEKRRLE